MNLLAPIGRAALVVLMTACVAVLPARAQSPQTEARAVEPVPDALELQAAHGWMTIRDDRDQSTILLHLPPRLAGADEWGTVRIAPGVSAQTDAIASYGSRAWLAMSPDRGQGNTRLRRFVSISTVRGIGGAWEYPPGRPEVLPPLENPDELVGLAATMHGPVAMTRARAGRDAASEWSLYWLSGTMWHELPLPWKADDGPRPGSVIRVFGVDASAIGIAVFPAGQGGEAAWRLHRAELLPATEGREKPAAEWTSETWPLSGSAARDGQTLAPDAVYAVGDRGTRQLVAVTWKPENTLEIVALRRSGVALLATVEEVPRDHRVAPLNGTASLAVLWWDMKERPAKAAEPPVGSTSGRTFTIAEVSALSGKELYRGPSKGGGLISGTEFKLLAIALLLMTSVVLLFALRSESNAGLLLPSGYVLADPVRRMVAAGADLVPGVAVAAFSMGLDFESMLSLSILVGPRAEPMAWLLALGLTILHCSAGEALTGRTIGKSLAGCETVGVRRGKDGAPNELVPLQPWQAVVRNVIRWSIPVLGVLMFIDGGRRHPADAAARTVVVVRVEEPEEE